MRRHTLTWSASLSAAALLLGNASAHAFDAGMIGPTYEIAEPHLLAFIEQRLRDMAASGELQRLEEEARARGVDAVHHPVPVEGLSPTGTRRTYYYDPSFTLDRNLHDADGRLMFAAGTRANPLEIVSLSRHLLFFDARDARQIAHAAALITDYGGRVKPILTGGSYLALMQTWRTPVYYDQFGLLTRRLGIRQVPALVSQEGLRLRIDELEVPR
ncbi:type-F conjugative transfer system protein TraW [Pseudothauera nasutitermitis]|uniref:Type-F conjugative transfer system protein TraW n=1 Tax=Pseudothauera nasutitermitis TaxID=2565930 RepID=A0A4S4AXV1_9RHOO|nr:type-F conjugative transfer system protein TraW [Pseudothauera nasutitermitis]THF64935.1 type-F conjugative transfer system protein TraW [Pseudothauera nasutitermitis]